MIRIIFHIYSFVMDAISIQVFTIIFITMVWFKNYNELHIINEDNIQRASVFVQEEPYCDEFIKDKCLETIEIVLKHLNMI